VTQYQRLRDQGRTPAQALAYVWRTRYARYNRHVSWDEMGEVWNQIVREIERVLAKETDAPVESRVADVARELGLPDDSRTVRRVLAGHLDMEKAREIAAKIRYRHEQTSYDEIVWRAGKENARLYVDIYE